ncbi:unnamed protein product [Bursaphelenchus xylophilus]|uniref:Fucosyltransferase n=1 Tax=Bursaphelenchus xylophilus TaxID=6326 RepID=A0A1I7RPA3_BURXY|nr:unnamed protein product [Bursaphelenchus xylophilus]CAG9095677.1 unnamed protein product [Bursaphelenchus xylophilus]
MDEDLIPGQGKATSAPNTTWPKLLGGLFLFSLVIVFVYWYEAGVGFTSSTYYLLYTTQILENSMTPVPDVPPSHKVILMWTTFFGSPSYFWEPGSNCNYSCIYTYDRRMLSNASLLIFHIRNTNSRDLPQSNAPKVFFSLESPYHTYFQKGKLKLDYFNYTMTYEEDSDMPQPYEYDVNKTYNGTARTIEEIREIISKKSKLALIAHSNCATKSKRGDLLKALQKRINITQVGRCVSRSCNSQCLDKLIESHYFYFAFENSICKDYTTEKFFRFTKYIVPVVLRRSFMPKRIPQDLYIAVDDFKNVNEFVDYLNLVANNHTLYEQYFNWSIEDKLPRIYDSKFYSMCHMCKMAHTLPPKQIPDYRKVFGVDKCDGNFVRRFLNQKPV